MPLNVPVGGIDDPGATSLAVPGDPSSRIIMDAAKDTNTTKHTLSLIHI